MFDVLCCPGKGIARAKKKKSFSETFLTLIASSLILILSFIIISASALKTLFFNLPISNSGLFYIFAGTIFVGSILFVLIMSLILNAFVYVMTGKKGYFEALTSLTYEFLAISVGIFLSSLIMFGLSSLAFFTIILVGLILSFSLVYGSLISLRAIKELYELDLLTSLVTFFAVSVFLRIFIISAVALVNFALFTNVFEAPFIGLYTAPSEISSLPPPPPDQFLSPPSGPGLPPPPPP